MATVAQGCCIALNRIKIMNWSAVCWYQLYLVVTHHRSDSIGHKVTSCRKYILKYDAIWLVRVELCKVMCPSPRTGIPRRGHLHQTSSRSASTVNITGWPSATMVGPQWPSKVRNCPTVRMAAAHKRTLVPTADQQPGGSSRTSWSCPWKPLSAGS